MERYLVYTTDEIAKRAIDPTRVFAVPQPQSPSSEAPVEKVGLAPGSGAKAEIPGPQLRAKSGYEPLRRGSPLFDHTVSASKQGRPNLKTQRLGSLEVDCQFIFDRC